MDLPKYAGDIINQLKHVGKVDCSTERLLQNVLDLSSNRWGRNNEPAAGM